MTKHNNLIRYNFDNSAAAYQQHALIQKAAALRMLDTISTVYHDGLILDMGSGPGTILHNYTHNSIQNSYADLPIVAYDLSHAMLNHSQLALRVNGDAQSLPFAAHSFSLIISNLMLQWPKNKLAVLKEIQRVLIPGSHALISVLISPSLWQLVEAWSKIDTHAHTLEFLKTSDYQQLCAEAGLAVVATQEWEECYYFANLGQLLHHFKLTGTTLAKAPNRQGLGGRKELQQLAEAYPAQDKGLALSYHYLYFIVTASS